MARETDLTAAQANAVLALMPHGTRIVGAAYFDNDSLPCPIRVDLHVPDGGATSVVVRLVRHGSVEAEAQVLAALATIGFPAPRVLAGPYHDPAGGRAFTVLSLVPGTSLQSLATTSEEGIGLAKRLLIAGVTRLHGLTDHLLRRPVAALLPRLDLPSQLRTCHDPHHPWSRVPLFVQALERLAPVLATIAAPLVFTNGDYQPGNFLHVDGEISGVVDFESAAFEDPLMGFAKYPIYDVHPLNRAGAVDAYLAAHGYTQRDFAPRLALSCLLTLLREIAVDGGDEHEERYREHVLSLLHHAIQQL